MSIRLIGDVHGLRQRYLDILSEYSLQIGDLDFNYEWLSQLDSEKHKVIRGNHDNPDESPKYKHFLADYGIYHLNGIDFFYVSGAYSIDQVIRREYESIGLWPKTWWENEELGVYQLEAAIALYKLVKPDLVITHEAPRSVVNNVTDGRVLRRFNLDPATFTTRTSEALNTMFQIHQPKRWFFGHYHRSVTFKQNGTQFQCLDELEFVDI